MKIKVENGVVKCVVCVEVDFTISDEGIEELIEDGELFSAWPWASSEEWEQARENAENYDNSELPSKVRSRLAEMAFDREDITRLLENELCNVSSDLGEISVGGVWVTDKF